MPTIRTTPLESPAFEAFKEAFQVLEPRDAARIARQNMLDAGVPKEEVDVTNPEGGTQKDYDQQLIFEMWTSGIPIYDSKDIWKALHLKEGYKNWKWRQRLPTVLTGVQAAFLLERGSEAKDTDHTLKQYDEAGEVIGEVDIRKSGGAPYKTNAEMNLINPRNPATKHPFPVLADQGRDIKAYRIRSKIGRTYSGWKLVRCLSESENTANNARVRYVGQCLACGNEQQLDYRRLNVSCNACVARVVKFDGELRSKLVIYKVDGAYMLSKELPPNATHRIEFTHSDMLVYEQSLFEDSTAIRVHEPVPEKKLSDVFDMSDMPDFS
jgi:DNA-directed RNA polymerase subunit RPC12/RpoP